MSWWGCGGGLGMGWGRALEEVHFASCQSAVASFTLPLICTAHLAKCYPLLCTVSLLVGTKGGWQDKWMVGNNAVWCLQMSALKQAEEPPQRPTCLMMMPPQFRRGLILPMVSEPSALHNFHLWAPFYTRPSDILTNLSLEQIKQGYTVTALYDYYSIKLCLFVCFIFDPGAFRFRATVQRMSVSNKHQAFSLVKGLLCMDWASSILHAKANAQC